MVRARLAFPTAHAFVRHTRDWGPGCLASAEPV